MLCATVRIDNYDLVTGNPTTAAPDPCQPDPCEHGLCYKHENGFKCMCDQYYYGDLCDKRHRE